MSLLFAELRKVWGSRVFPMLLAVLAAANLLLLWMETRPTDNQPPAGSYRAVGAELSGMGMEEKGVFLHDKLTEYESILRIGYYYQQLAYGSLFMQSYREENADLFDRYEQEYLDQSYPLYTGSLNTDYALFTQLCDEYDTVAAYPEFLDSVQAKANQLAGISIFQKDETGYDLKNIDLTAQVYAGLGETVIDYYPQKGLYTAISYAFTDLILLAGILVLALLLVRRERDSGLLSLVRSLPGGRLKTALAKLGAFALSLLAVLALLYGVNLAYCGAAFGLGPLTRTIQSVPALMRCTMQITVGQYLFRFFAGQVGRGLCHGALGDAGGADCPPGRGRLGGGAGRAACDVRHPGGHPGHQPVERPQVCESCQFIADQRAAGQLPQPVLVRRPRRSAAGGMDGGGTLRRGAGVGILLDIHPRPAAARRQSRLRVWAAPQDPRNLCL